MAKPLQTIAAGKFKAECLKIMDIVHNKHISVTITKRGKPIAKLVPTDEDKAGTSFGCMKATAVIKMDIVEPIDESWDAD